LALVCVPAGVPAGSAAATGDLIQKPGTAGCLSADAFCSPGTALVEAISVTVSPDGASAYAASFDSSAVAVFDRAPDGTLTQKPGTAGCVSETGTSGACVDGTGLDGPTSVTVSPDGASVYVASRTSSAVAVFDRAPDGTLTQKPGAAGCISETGSAGACVDGKALNVASSVVVSPDGSSAYVASGVSRAVAVFDRAPNGTLTQKPGTAGCISETGTAGACTAGPGLTVAISVVVSPDGASAYVASFGSNGAVAVFDRAPDGTLTRKPGAAGCISETGSAGACVDGTALGFANSVTVSPDGASAYVASYGSSAVAVFDRAPDGTLTQKPGTAGCVSDTGAGPCVDGTGLDGASSVAVSPDGASAYVASYISAAVAVFGRAPDGTLTQKPGTAGCVSETGSAGACADGAALSGASSVAVSPDGASAYVASYGSSAVAVFDRDPGRSPPPEPPPPAVDLRAPLVTFTKPACPRKLRRQKAKCRAFLRSRKAYQTLRGTVTDPSGIRSVEVNVVRKRGKICRAFTGKAFKRIGCRKAARRFVKAKLRGQKWSLELRGLKPGTYTIRVRATDRAGNASKAATLARPKLGR
jgi:DNA-binding beta-propeller fold protein YncE